MALGTPYFIKKTFGVGYKVMVQKTPGTEWQPQTIVDSLVSIVPQYSQQYQSYITIQPQAIIILVPFQLQHALLPLFSFLENTPYSLSLEMNTLEDAFINIGLNDPSSSVQITGEQESPSCPTRHSFPAQLYSVLLKKFWVSRRSFAIVTSYLSPLVFILVSVVIQHSMDKA